MTPNFDGLPNLERFNLRECRSLKEIHPSIIDLKKLVLLCIEGCDSLKMFPRILGPMKLQTLSFVHCKQLFNQHQNMDHSSPHNNMSNIGLGLCLNDLRKLNLGSCSLGDEEIGSAVWDLPNLIKLDLYHNKFSRLNFSRLRLPRLKSLDVSDNEKLVELSELPSSIAVVRARYCRSLESVGDISNCKWLWNVLLLGENNLGLLRGDILLYSMLQGNAIEDYFISVVLQRYMIPKWFVGRLFWGSTRTLRLPDDWYNDFCGFSICIVTHMNVMEVDIVINQEVDKGSAFERLQISNEAVEPEYEGTKTHVGYVSFGSLRHSALSNSSSTTITVSFEVEPSSPYEYQVYYIGAQLVPRKSRGDQPQTRKVPTNSSEFWDEELDYGYGSRPFRIIHDSKSSMKIKWLLY